MKVDILLASIHESSNFILHPIGVGIFMLYKHGGGIASEHTVGFTAQHDFGVLPSIDWLAVKPSQYLSENGPFFKHFSSSTLLNMFEASRIDKLISQVTPIDTEIASEVIIISHFHSVFIPYSFCTSRRQLIKSNLNRLTLRFWSATYCLS